MIKNIRSIKSLSLFMAFIMTFSMALGMDLVNPAEAMAAVEYKLISYHGTANQDSGTTLPSVNGHATQRRAITGHAYVEAIFGTGGWSSGGGGFNNVDYRMAFDGTEAGGTGSYFDGYQGGHCGVEFKEPLIVSQISYQARQDAARLNGAVLQGSNDGTNYTPLLTLTGASTSTMVTRNIYNSNLIASTPYKYYRVLGTTQADMFNPQEIFLFTYADGTDPIEVLDIPGTMKNGDKLMSTSVGETITWSADKADMLNGNTIVARPFTTELTLTAKIGDKTKDFNVTVIGVLDDLTIPDTLYEGYVLPADVEWEVPTSNANMLNGKTIVARALNTPLTLTAKSGSGTKDFNVIVIGILDDITLPKSLTEGYVLPVTSFGKTVNWEVKSGSDAAMLNADGKTIVAKALNTPLTLIASSPDLTDTREITVTVYGILDGLRVTDPVGGGSILPNESFGKAITWTAVPSDVLKVDDGVYTIIYTGTSTAVTLTASWNGATKEFTRQLSAFPPKSVSFNGTEWTWTASGNSTGEIAGGGNGPNAFQIGSENPRSRYFMYDSKQEALDYFTLYPMGYGEEIEDLQQDSPSDWYLNLNGTWKFRYDRAPRDRVWPISTSSALSSNGSRAINDIFGTNAVGDIERSSIFPTGQYGFDTTESYTQTNDKGVITNKNGWDDISVPSNWQVNWNSDGTLKYDVIAYVNQPLPWTSVYGNGNGGAGTGNNHGNVVPSAPDVSNGVGTYQREVTIPSNWANKRVFLNFDGVDSCYVWVDGVPIGYTEDKFTHHEFDVTEALRSRGSIAGTHTITVQVIRWATGSHFEGQDFLRLSGIFRNIYLMARNTEDLWDFQIDTKPVSVANLNDGTPTDWTFSLKTALRDYSNHLKEADASKTVHYELIDANGKKVAEGSGSGTYAMQTTPLGRDSYDGVFGGGVRWHADADNRTATGTNLTSARISLAKPSEFVATISAPDVHMWSTEDPYLYKLVMWVDNGEADTEYTAVRVGFRYVDYSRGGDSGTTANAGRLLINGKRVTFYGTNAHEMNPDYGQTFPLGYIRKDIELMKRTNINAIRMSHYPHDPRYYDLASEYGLYIMDEANIELHWAGNGSTSNATNRSYTGPLVRDRQLNMFERDKNYASVVAWSIGNESGISTSSAGYLLHVLEKREADITQRGRGYIAGQSASGTTAAAHRVAGRPSHSEWGGDRAISQLYSNMYPSITSWYTQGGGGAPLVNCEYAHHMGNSGGNMDSWAYMFESRNHDTGGFIWDWVDQSILTPLVSNGEVVGSYYAYGGDWGEERHDGHFSQNGVISANRTEKPHTQEIRRQYQQIKTSLNGDPTSGSVGINVLNKFMYTNANEYDMTWDITENGKVIRSGSGVFDVDPVPYGTGADSTSTERYTRDKFTQKSFTIDFEPIAAKPNAEYFFSIQFRLRDDITLSDGNISKGWAEKGYIIAQDQHQLTSSDFVNSAKQYTPLSVAGMVVTGDMESNNTGSIKITGPIVGGTPLFEYEFNKENTTGDDGGGRFTSMKYMGKEFMTSGPQPSFYRAPNDNERGGGGRGASINNWRTVTSGRTRGATPVTVSTEGNCVTITAPYTSSRNVNSGSKSVYTIYPDGEIKVAQTYVFGAADSLLADLGSNMIVSPGLDNLTYFGRGPTENATDRRWGSNVGIWSSTVADEFTHYLCSQHMGNHIDTRWLALTDNDGFGVVVKSGDFAANNIFRGNAPTYNPNEIARNASGVVEFYALYYTQQELDGHHSHPETLYLDKRDNKAGIGNPIQLNVNLASRGVGGDNSWGQDAHEVYRIQWANSTYNYNYSIMPVSDINDFDPTNYSRKLRNYRQNVRDLLTIALEAGVSEANPAYIAADTLADDATDVDSANAYTNLIKALAEIKPIINLATVNGVSAAPDADNNIRITLPSGSDLTALTPNFETVIANGSSLSISKSGPQDFSVGPVEYTLTANGIENKYLLFIDSQDSARFITSFVLAGEKGRITYNSAGEGTIVVDLSKKDVSDMSLIPDSIDIIGSSITPAWDDRQDFSKPVEYIVTAEDGSTRKYTVIVPGLHLKAESGKVTLNAVLIGGNIIPAAADAKLILAVYDADGKLVSTTTDTVSYDDTIVPKTLTADLPVGAKVKAFLWNADYVPIILAKEL